MMRIGNVFIYLLGITFLMNLLPAGAMAHFSILIPDKHDVRRGEEVRFRYYQGHPYEAEYALRSIKPEHITIKSPAGQTTTLEPEAQQVEVSAEERPEIWSFAFMPEERGDHLVLVRTPLHFDEHLQAFVQDEVKLILHVQTQQGWDRSAGATAELMPLIRPYGLEPGLVVKLQARLHQKPVADVHVEVERYNEHPPGELPENDAMITRVVKSDVNGYAICTLNEPGWWGWMAEMPDGTRRKDGRDVPVLRRAHLWIYVHPKFESGNR